MQKKYLHTLLIVLFFTITLVPACNKHHRNSSPDKKVISEKSFKISPGKMLIVNVGGADVSVNSWDKSEVHIKVWGGKDAKDKLNINYNNDDSSVELSIEEKHPFLNWFSNNLLNVEVKVPENFNTNISTSGGDINLVDVKGAHQLETSGGDVDCQGFTGNLKVSTSGGDISLQGTNSQIEAETSGGDIMLNYSGENLGINLSTSGGDIDVKIPSDFNASMELSTSGGDVSCNLNLTNVQEKTDDEIIADLNKGGKMFSASTSGGDISVRKK